MSDSTQSTILSTKELTNRKVWFSRPRKNDPDAVKKLGRIRSWVFAPKEARVVGFLVRRPDVALMFHRRDTFVAVNGFGLYGMEEESDSPGDGKSGGYIVISDDPKATDKGACKSLGIRLDDCVLWIGLPVMCADGTSFGLVGDVFFNQNTGRVVKIVVDQGGTANTLLGKRVIPANKILGFKRGMGAKLYMTDDDGAESDPESLGAIIVDESVKELALEGGAAEAAGAATAVVADKAKKAVRRVTPKVKDAASKATGAVGAVASAASEAVSNSAKAASGDDENLSEATSSFGKAASNAAEKGAYATGRQLVRATGMFGRFKDEFSAALNDGDASKSSGGSSGKSKSSGSSGKGDE